VAPVIAFRVAIALQPSVTRWVVSSAPVAVPAWLIRSEKLWERLSDPGESDSDLSLAVSDATGYPSDVATFTGAFTTRKLQILFGRTSGASLPEDDAVITFHLLKLVTGAPDDTWETADFTTAETAFDAFWNTIKPQQLSVTTLKQYRWYKAGPEVEDELGGPGRTGPPVRVVDRALPGTSGATIGSPPQVAVTITEKTADKKAWGRVYIPGPHYWAQIATASGRIASSYQTILGNAADTLYEAMRTANTPIVVYSSAKPERPAAAGGTLPAKAARALTVDELQIDDIPDVIRSRRYETPLLRLLRTVG